MWYCLGFVFANVVLLGFVFANVVLLGSVFAAKIVFSPIAYICVSRRLLEYILFLFYRYTSCMRFGPLSLSNLPFHTLTPYIKPTLSSSFPRPSFPPLPFPAPSAPGIRTADLGVLRPDPLPSRHRGGCHFWLQIGSLHYNLLGVQKLPFSIVVVVLCAHPVASVVGGCGCCGPSVAALLRIQLCRPRGCQEAACLI